MDGAEDIIRKAAELPIEERVLVIDSLLKTLNHPDPGIDREWLPVAKRRLEELRSGATRPIPGSDVFSRIRDRYSG